MPASRLQCNSYLEPSDSRPNSLPTSPGRTTVGSPPAANLRYSPVPPPPLRRNCIELRRARPTSLRQGYGGPPKLQRRRKRLRREGGQSPVDYCVVVRLLVATTNRNKVREIHQLLDGVPVDLTTLDELPVREAPGESG